MISQRCDKLTQRNFESEKEWKEKKNNDKEDAGKKKRRNIYFFFPTRT